VFAKVEMMAIQFQPLKLEDQRLFGISLMGTVSRSDKSALQELADQAMSRGKVKLVLDLSGLTSLGGSGARVLADFQRKLIAADGEAVFAGVGTVVRHFLDGKFENLPLRYFLSVEDAVQEFYSKNYTEPDHSLLLPAESDEGTDQENIDTSDPQTEDDDVGAMSFHDDENPDSGLDNLLGEFTSKEARKGRRKEHHYTSLSKALEALGTWHNGENRQGFANALTNLLFSQGLAETVSLLFPSGNFLQSTDGDHRIPAAGAFAGQLVEYARPLTILDLHDDELVESEIAFLEAKNPEMILPLLQDGKLIGVILLSNEGVDRDYSVGENFAFELLIKVLSGSESTVVNSGEKKKSTSGKELVEAANSVAPSQGTDSASDLHETLYRLALDLPEADDRPHFWRIFSRHVSKIMPLEELAFLAPDSSRPQVMTGHDQDWMALNLGTDRLQMFFRTMERPVRVANLPSLFKDTRDKMVAAGIHWLVGLNWEEQYQGMVLLGCQLDDIEMFPEERLMQLLEPTARLLARYDGRNEDAGVTQSLVQTLVAEREVRCFGSDSVTREMVQQLNLLAREMGFPPDQHRDLVYGCLLRDIGLVGQPDALMVAPADMSPEQLQVYYKHPERGRDLLNALDLPETIVEVVSCHHERYNGQGYPEGLAGRDIPLAARVVTVVENYVAMITGIGLPEPMAAKDAAQEIRLDEGGRFDPDIVTVFLQAVLPENFPKTESVKKQKRESVEQELEPVT
jgi:anti-anti-sigma regulatory factor